LLPTISISIKRMPLFRRRHRTFSRSDQIALHFCDARERA
jgi:hypothetical protein